MGPRSRQIVPFGDDVSAAGIERGDHAAEVRRARGLGHGLERRHSFDRNSGGAAEAPRRRETDAQPGERARPGADHNAVAIP